MEQTAGKWKGLIIYHLLDETLRFNELSRRVGSDTQRSLTKQLRELEADGIVRREVFAVVPPKVEYSLTEKGQQLRDAMEALRLWGSQHPKRSRFSCSRRGSWGSGVAASWQSDWSELRRLWDVVRCLRLRASDVTDLCEAANRDARRNVALRSRTNL